MRQTVVPAQITSVEDKITGNLTIKQLILLTSPIFIDLILYIVFPPFTRINLFKLIIAALIDILFWISAIRFKGKMLIVWWIIIAKYNSRPAHYIFNKNTTHTRNFYMPDRNNQQQREEPSIKIATKKSPRNISVEEAINIGNLIKDTNLRLSFISSKKAGLNVHITQIK
jgi:hypothetical protein